VVAGRIDKSDALIIARGVYFQAAPSTESNVMFTHEVGLPVCKAMVSFGKERYEDVVGTLMPIRKRLNLFGGSHAQRDAVQRTLLEAALRANKTDVARVLVSERIALKPTSPYNWLAQARLLDELGRSAASVAAAETASGLQSAGAARFAAV